MTDFREIIKELNNYHDGCFVPTLGRRSKFHITYAQNDNEDVIKITNSGGNSILVNNIFWDKVVLRMDNIEAVDKNRATMYTITNWPHPENPSTLYSPCIPAIINYFNINILHPNNDIVKINLLNKREFAIPNLNWEEEIPLLVGIGTIPQMITNMSNSGFKHIIDFVNIKTTNNITSLTLEKLIKDEIEKYVNAKNKEDELFEKIFHLIQLWGGNAGRMFYFSGKVNFVEYKSLINLVLKTNDPELIISELKKIINSENDDSKLINIAFITKHVSLWQRFGTNFKNPLPIYDSIIAKNVMGVVKFNKKNKKWEGFTNNDWKSLSIYWESMNSAALFLRVSTSQIERQVFNFFRDKNWDRNYGN